MSIQLHIPKRIPHKMFESFNITQVYIPCKEPSYLGKIILVSVRFKMVLTQTITRVYKDYLILTCITILIHTNRLFGTIIDVTYVTIRCYEWLIIYILWPHPHSMLRFYEHIVEFSRNRIDSIWSQSLQPIKRPIREMRRSTYLET